MNIKQIAKIYETIKRVASELSKDNLNPEKLDVTAKLLESDNGNMKFLTSNIDLEEVVFYNKALPEETFENLEYLLNQEKDMAEAILIYVRKTNQRLRDTRKTLLEFLDESKKYNHSDSDLLLNLLYEKTEDIKLYFYEVETLFNVAARKDFFEILNKDLTFTEDYKIVTDTNEGYMKITFPVNTFINIVEFNPLFRSNDKYSVFINKDNTIDTLVSKDEELSIKGLTTVNDNGYHLVIKGNNIYNLSSEGLKIKIGNRESANSIKRGFSIIKAKLDFPNGNFRIVNSENKNIDMYLVPTEYEVNKEWLFADIEEDVINKGYKKIVMNVDYDDSLIDNKILLMFESSSSIYRGLKILKV